MPSRASSLQRWTIPQENLSYAGTIAALSFILLLGHSTHWEFWPDQRMLPAAHLPAAKRPEKFEATSSVNGVAEWRDSGSVPLSNTALAKAGIELAPVREQSVATSITVSGVVAYNHNLRAELATRVPGNVWRIEKHVGEPIHKGDVLAIIEASDVGRAKGELLQAIVERELKATNFERLQQLGGGVAERQVREAEAAARQAAIHARVCAQALINLGIPVELAELEKASDDERASRIRFAGLPESIVSMLDARTTTANLLPLVAPFDGVVIGRNLAIGELVSPDMPHFEVADIRKVWVLLDIRKEDANQVRLGQSISFKPDGYDGEVAGVIDWISTAMDEKTRTLQVRAEVENPVLHVAADDQPTYLLRAHTYGAGRILIRDSQAALVVPAEAVQLEKGKNYIFVRERGCFVRKAVELGSTEAGLVEIRSGLSGGMTVATTGSHVLKAQMQIAAAAQ
jgi:cobalt-zinc-cadmium efflux system membrane fusion protein